MYIHDGYNKNQTKMQDYGFKNPVLRSSEKMSEGNKPDYEVSTPIKNGEKTYWARIGSAWKTEKGISIKLNALPLSADVMLFAPKEDK